jgi:hypothetical protein
VVPLPGTPEPARDEGSGLVDEVSGSPEPSARAPPPPQAAVTSAVTAEASIRTILRRGNVAVVPLLAAILLIRHVVEPGHDLPGFVRFCMAT